MTKPPLPMNDMYTGQSDQIEFGETPSHAGDVHGEKATTNYDPVFGEIREGGPNYRSVGWVGSAGLMMKTQIGLGVLSVPVVFGSMGIIPGIIILCTIAGITTWSGYIVGVTKNRYPHVYGLDDIGDLMFGRIGREVLGLAFALFFTFSSAGGMLSISIALNSLSTHATCTAVYVAAIAVFCFIFSSIQTLGKFSLLAWLGVSSIVVAVFIVTIGVGVQGGPAPELIEDESSWTSDYKLVGKPTFNEAMGALTTLIYTYCGTPAFFNIAAEMKDPKQYTKALALCQGFVTIVYIVVGIIIYYFCGSYVASPALGSAGALIKMVSYGFALPGLLVSAILPIHLSAKFIFMRFLRGSEHLTANSITHWVTWLGSTLTITVVSYCIASGIPIFEQLVALIGALLGPLMSFQPMGCMWLFDNWKRPDAKRSPRWFMGVAWSAFVIIAGMFLLIAGTYSAISTIVNSPDGTGAWSCADNSNST